MHAATSAMFRGTSLPRHLRSGAESSGSVQNPLLRGRSSNHSEPSVDTSSTNPSHPDQLPPAALSVITATPSVVHASQSVDLSVVMRELSAMRKEMKQAIAHLQAEQAKIGPAIAYLTELLLTIEKSPFKVCYGHAHFLCAFLCYFSFFNNCYIFILKLLLHKGTAKQRNSYSLLQEFDPATF